MAIKKAFNFLYYGIISIVALSYFMFAILSEQQDVSNLAAEAYVQNFTKEALRILSANNWSSDNKGEALYDLYIARINQHALEMSLLEQSKNSVTNAQLSDFSKALRLCSIGFLKQHIDSLSSPKITVVGSGLDKSRHIIVYSFLVTNDQLEIPINWQLKKVEDTFFIVDLEISDIWINRAERAYFKNSVKTHSGNIQSFLTEFKRMAQHGESCFIQHASSFEKLSDEGHSSFADLITRHYTYL